MNFNSELTSPNFIVGNLKSGTTLLLSLLDGHPDLFTIPVELKFFKASRAPTLSPGNDPYNFGDAWSTPLKYPPSGSSQTDVKKRLFENPGLRSLLEDGELPRSICITPDTFDATGFRKQIYETEVDTESETLELLISSFRSATRLEGESSINARIVEKTPHQEEFAYLLKKWFPDATFLHMLRNPYANIHSLTKKAKRRRGLRHHVYRPTAKSLYFMERNRLALADYHIIKYEDVVTETDSAMRRVADILDISYEPDTMTRPTFWGRPWGGNSRTLDEAFTGVDPRPATAFEGEISEFHKAVVNRFFANTLEKYGYEKKAASRLKALIPDKPEDPINYLNNRKMLFDRSL